MRSVRRMTVITLLAAFCLALVFAATGQPQVLAAEKEKKPTAIYKVDTDQKVVALTFDISWGNKVPDPTLDVLEKEKVKKATFFLSGPWTLRHPETAKRIHEMGYEIGSHGNLHKDFSNYPDSWIREQVSIAERSIQQVTGVKPTLIRTPNGDFNPRVLRCLNQMGYTVIQWNTDSLDWKNPGTQAIVNRVLKRAEPGDIILMHASDSSKQITEALPQIIDGLRAKGYQFVTVSELLAQAKVQSKVE
ncbi:polysaccharide deacetylase family sporulation protein PdaB [Alicyclobacillus cycloheptanicus]|uniref:Polysaccharide deacetylase family sporulation protein PdaB n=1 Tax=Alicyclobacillus cycloheptanicus TaxID=1457 RepID=A0ABT9XJR1_9BACL|nr:polysaccharide deacetylase family sporulation protein PdaB [Alicyclobacillus cycloheptanicus]MDQ0190442.1 polysaccharide deacetylase family sporulation protein PdaB [Alicyclobacillus cycloheptanicus]WDM02681.1 polysaccharide deacetylase family sporulation protein PdaB [Alicyclobacillus cycloheptanicus]